MLHSVHHKIEYLPTTALKPAAVNPRTHSAKQLKQLVGAITRFGFLVPPLVDDDLTIIAGHARVEAAKKLGLETVPCLRISHLTPEERRAFLIAENRLSGLGGWNNAELAAELKIVIDYKIDPEILGFDLPEVDLLITAADDSKPAGPSEEDDVPQRPEPHLTISRHGDLWKLGRHLLLIGDAKDPGSFSRLMWGKRADMLFTDSPYNQRVSDISGSGRTKHREFVEASGEMSPEEFTAFLTVTLQNAASACRDGAIAYTFMDWRHMGEMLAAGNAAFTDLRNLCVWAKNNGGLGTFYRSRHELVFVWKIGTAPHTNTFGLGDRGRYRTNVWSYAGVNSFRSGRMEELRSHPTVKPTALVADAIRDVTNRGEMVLDCFGGSGTTLIAAEITGRIARLIEIDPAYGDVTIRRFEKLTGERAVLATSGMTFEKVGIVRSDALACVGA